MRHILNTLHRKIALAIAIVVATALIGIAVAVLIADKAASVAMEIGLNGSAMFLGKIIRDTRRRRLTLT